MIEDKDEKKWTDFLNSKYLSGGNRPRYSPKKLWEKFIEYVNECQENPYYKDEVKVVSKGEGLGSSVEHVAVAKARMVTVEGFYLYAGLSKPNFYRYMSGEHGKGKYKDICNTIVESVNQLRAGLAAADLLNANFVARLMGLSDKMTVTNMNIEVSKEEAKQISKQLDDEL